MMVKPLKTLLVGASVLTGLSAFASAPALAASIASPVTGGANDVLLYESDGTNTFLAPGAPLTDILEGDSSDPDGNVELFASSESAGFSADTTLSGTLNGKSIVLSSLVESDWDVFGLEWFGKFLDAALNPDGQLLRAGSTDAALYAQFSAAGGRETFSDPNISYVNQDDPAGDVKIGLAGHFNAFNRITSQIPFLTPYLKDEVQASEIVKVEYDDGEAQYLYSFLATESNLVELDEFNEKGEDATSHTGNYEVSLKGQPPVESVPEPATALSLLVVGGLFAASKRKSQTA